ncbi:chorismate mutase [Halobacillus mangrovi]|uniref:chorismate mutase n=1 Tax=Halobacillus mangrovi TaxID=402384 RepID=A0A1W5ZVC3_9BACI|nr:chorismate mutase [Halobacillus mangrovi]ARI77254.1 chorismate mutase [Halobacillus mangrovi]
MIRGIRGATTVENNEAKEIISRSVDLLQEMVKENDIKPDDVASVFFTVTGDINDTFPAKSLRELEGWTYVPVMCMTEIPVPGSLPLCIRVMVTVNTDKEQKEVKHIYHYEARQLRPDLKR